MPKNARQDERRGAVNDPVVSPPGGRGGNRMPLQRTLLHLPACGEMVGVRGLSTGSEDKLRLVEPPRPEFA